MSKKKKFLTLEDGTDRLSQNVRNYHSTLHNISDECRSHMTIWWCRLWFGFAWSGPALHTRI